MRCDRRYGLAPPCSDVVTFVVVLPSFGDDPMDLREWSKSNAEYGRELLHSGIEGARSGGEAFLHGEPLAPFLSHSVRRALKPAVVGACLFVLGSCPKRQKSI